jgi:hypothetical protein
MGRATDSILFRCRARFLIERKGDIARNPFVGQQRKKRVMATGKRGNGSDRWDRKEGAPAAKQAPADADNWNAEIDTSALTDSEATKAFYPPKGNTGPRSGIFWNDAESGKSPRASWMVALLSGFAGTLVSGLFMAAAFSLEEQTPVLRPPGGQLVGDDRSAGVTATTCLLFFGTVYLTGEILYRRLGEKSELIRVKELRRQHLPLIGLLAGAAVSYWPFMQIVQKTARPLDWLLLSVGLLFLVGSITGLIQAFQSRVPYSWLRSRH